MTQIETIAEGITLYPGDCMAVLATLDEGSIDSCVTDPPYHLTSIVKRFGAENAAPAKTRKTGAYARASRGFMGKVWDGGEIAFEPETWAAVLRVLKPGGHLLAFGAPKNFGFMQYAIAQAGFEVRDVLAWIFGSGFPKSHDAGDGWGTALKPAYEPIIMARKPLIGTVAANVSEHQTGAINIDACRVETPDDLNGGTYSKTTKTDGVSGSMVGPLRNAIGKTYLPPQGRWPANVVHDGSDEVVDAFPEAPGQQRYVGPEHGDRASKGIYGDFGPRPENPPRGDSGSAARFFYTAKADADDRLGSKHPTVKPIDLMQWLVRLITPRGGLVLDPFAGTGTTGEAAFREGMRAILIEREPEYQDDIRRRMGLVLGGPEERQRASIKARGLTADAGPLFEGITS
jgi:site-specific DNA-methyltransferase (adenine-specific)